MAFLNDVLESKNTLRYLPRFLTVGMLSTLVDLGLFTLLHVRFGVPTLAANTISYSAGIITSYVLHRTWTYSNRPRRALRAQFSQFAAVSLSALLINNALVLLLASPFTLLLTQPSYGALLAKVCATGVGLCWNFIVNNFWTFAEAGEEARQ